jgi:hypothetical protein
MRSRKSKIWGMRRVFKLLELLVSLGTPYSRDFTRCGDGKSNQDGKDLSAIILPITIQHSDNDEENAFMPWALRWSILLVRTVPRQQSRVTKTADLLFAMNIFGATYARLIVLSSW